MSFSVKQKITLWTTAILIILFMGLSTKMNDEEMEGYWRYHQRILYLYGHGIGLSAEGFTFWKKEGMEPINLKRGVYFLYPIGYYKYQVIIATFLIGLALFITLTKPKERGIK